MRLNDFPISSRSSVCSWTGQTHRRGSASWQCIAGSVLALAAESLAGRVELIELAGLTVADIGHAGADRLWLRGGLPPSFTASTDDDSAAWRDRYVTTFLERDLAQLGVRIPASTMRRAWTMLAHYHGQTWNGAKLARALAVAETTARRYVDALTDALIVRQLQPWFANISKRQRRSPKIYVRDSGLLHRLRASILGSRWSRTRRSERVGRVSSSSS